MSKVTIRTILYKQRVLANGTAQICLVITCNRQKSMVPLGLYVAPDWWMPECCEVNEGYPNGSLINATLRMRLSEAKMVHLLMEGQGKTITLQDLKKAIVARLFPEKTEQPKPMPKSKPKVGTLSLAWERFTASKKGNTLRLYNTAKRRIIDWLGADKWAVQDVDSMGRGWLADFDAWLSETCTENTRAVYMRHLRAVCNFALDEELATKYPFRRFHIKTIKTAKRSLAIEELRKLWYYPIEISHRHYLDFFKLSFLLCGINPIDLLQLPKDAIVDGRIVYNRAKTKHLYSIKVEPEAMSIIKQYPGKKYLLNFCDDIATIDNYRHRAGNVLKTLGPVEIVGKHGKKVRHPLWPNLTMYWARHTWATLAADLDIPRETIALGLGHSWQDVTEIYIKRQMKKVDEANRKIIDYVAQKREFEIKKAIAQ